MANWQRVATIDQIPAENGYEVIVGDSVIAIFHAGDAYLAIDGICAHAGGPLAEGTLHGCIVTCPWHGWQYDVTSGEHCLNQLIRQRMFPVKVEDNTIYVDVSDGDSIS